MQSCGRPAAYTCSVRPDAGLRGRAQAPSHGVVQVTLVRGKRKAGAMSYSADPRGRQEQSWPGGPDRKFCRFVLQKENMDTQAALGLLSRMLHCKPSAVPAFIPSPAWPVEH